MRSIMQPKTIGVMIATYHRSTELLNCLAALERQLLAPDQVIVVAREDDSDTRTALAAITLTVPLRLVTLREAGVVAARNAGLNASTTDIVAIIDDDTVPHFDWLSNIMIRYRNDPALGGLGGRDRCFDGYTFDERQEDVVGKIQWFGRVIGNHHLGYGEIREVDLLKGANMSFRADAIEDVRFDSRLKGDITQPNDDKCFSIAVKVKGWKLAYDPAILVDHYPGFREDGRQYVGVTQVTDVTNFKNFAYNEVVSVWDLMSGPRRIAYFVWSCLIGTATFPGLLQAIRFTPKLGIHSWFRFWLAQQAKLAAFRDLSV